MNYVLHENLEPDEIVEILIEKCGIMKCQKIERELQVRLEDKMREIIKNDRPEHEKWADVSPTGSY